MRLPGLLRGLLFRNYTGQIGETRVTGGGHGLSERLALLMFIDGILLFLVVWGAATLVPYIFKDQLEGIGPGLYWGWLPVLLCTWWLFASLHDLYELSALHRRIHTAIRVVMAGLTVVATCYVVTLFVPLSWAFEFALYFLSTAIPLLIVWRLAYISVSKMPRFSRRALIVGRGERAQHAAELVKQHSFLNYQILGYLSDGPDAPELTLEDVPVSNDPMGVVNWVRQAQIHEIIIASEGQLDRQLFLSLLECQAHGAQIVWLPDLYEQFRYNVPVHEVDPQWVLHAVQFGPNIIQRMAKRLLDLIVVFFALPVLLVFIPLVALAIKLDSPGPVFYRQARCGRSGKLFMIYKFRTMYVDAEKDGKARWATKDDPRITRVGRLLRKARLDELPQVLNILQGEMSIVGPRPERPEFVQELKQVIPYYHTRLLVKPGLTGWAQIQFNYTSTVEDTVTKLQYDLYYIHRWTLWLDIYIMFRTIGVVLGLKGT